MTLRKSRRRLRVDRQRLLECFRARGVEVRCVRCSPAYVAVALYRYSRLCFTRGWRLSARLLWQVNLFLTGADVSPLSDLGEGLLIVHPFAVTITGSAGRNLAIEGWGGMGAGLAMDDIGAGPGLPLLGDDVSMDRGAMVLGPTRIGNSVRIGPGCTVVHDVADGCEVLAHSLRVRHSPAASGATDA